MGDRCYFTIWLRAEDAESEEGKELLESYGLERTEVDGASQEWSSDSMNYGGQDFLEGWVGEGFMCCGSQNGGGSYGPSAFCSLGRSGPDAKPWTDLHEECVGINSGYVVGFTSEGEPDPEDLARIKAFILLEKKVEAAINETPMERLAAAHNTERGEE